MRIDLIKGDITTLTMDAIVNAANSSLLGGGGVDGAIHRVGGPEILAECRQLRETRFPKGLPTGEAAATTGGRLPARWIIHTVGPIYGRGTAEQLRCCYTNSIVVADEIGAKTVAFPLISAGVYGWPKDDAIRQAFDSLSGMASAKVESVAMVLFDTATLKLAERITAG